MYHMQSSFATIILAALLLSSQGLFAQGSISVRGRVFDKKSGEPLPGANVIVLNSTLGASTNLDGRFDIRNVPVGRQTFKASYIGYVTLTVEQEVRADAPVDLEIGLTAQALTGEEVLITAQAQGQNAAINQQLSSNTIANVVSAARIKEVPDVNAAESIGRLPGVAINRSGGEANNVAIRGLSAKYNLVTVNGVRLPATGDDRNSSLRGSITDGPDSRSGGNDRSADLSLISSNMLDGIELKKANTPDMDADVLGGTVDLKLKEAPEEFQLNASLQGGYNQLQKYYKNYNFSATASNRFLDGDLGVIGSVMIDDYDRSADKFTGRYRQEALSTIVIEHLDLREENVTRGRTGASLLLDYRIPNGKVSSNFFYNKLNWEGMYRINIMQMNYNRHYYDLEDRHGVTEVFTGGLGIKQDYDWIKFDVDGAVTTSRGRNPNERVWRFAQENTAFNIHIDENTDPAVVPDSARIDTLGTGLADIYVFDTRRDENQQMLQLNVTVPFRLGDITSGYLKAGGKLRWLDRQNDEEVQGVGNLQYGGSTGINTQLAPIVRALGAMYPEYWNWERDSTFIRGNGLLPITRFLSDYSRSNFLDGEYPLGFGMDVNQLNRATEALKTTPWYMRFAVNSDGRDYDGVERYQAGYLMAELNFLEDYFTVLPGVRYERDYSLYHGQSYRAVTIGGAQQAPPLDFTRITAERDNEFWLPMVHVIVRPLEWLKLRIAGTQTLTRPDYRHYAPITYITADQSQIVAANLTLKPAVSTNYDVSVSVFENSIGLFTVSGFYKEIKDLIFSTRYDTSPTMAPPPGSAIPPSWLSASPAIYSYNINNPFPAYIRGIELEWQTHFWYLPSFLKGLVLNVNATAISSAIKIQEFYRNRIIIRPIPPVYGYQLIDSSRTARVPDQPARIFNVTLGYDYEGFSARLSYLYQTDRVSGIDRNDKLDSFTGDYARWDLTLQQRLDWGITLFANLVNLNSRPDKTYRGNALINPTYIEYYGFTCDVGVRFRF